jgi:GGDEF domain-containing protein
MDADAQDAAADGRHICCTMTTVMLRLVADEVGPHGVEALLQASGINRTRAFLEVEENWISLDEAHMAAIARRVREACARPFRLPGGEVTIGASVGDARWPVDGDGVEALLRHADAAMYREKSRSRAA